jgi:hypothetical protein
LDSEQWVVVEVPGSFQDIVNRLIRRSGEGAAAMGGEVVPAAPPQAASAQSTAQSTPGQPSQQSVTLEVNGKRFHLVNSALMLLKLLDEYLALYDIVPSFGAEIVHRMLELLKQFNAQTCQLVLGAGAMRTAGLKSISAKQLALSCQCIGMLSALHPLLRVGCLALVSQPRRALLIPEFDRLLQVSGGAVGQGRKGGMGRGQGGRRGHRGWGSRQGLPSLHARAAPHLTCAWHTSHSRFSPLRLQNTPPPLAGPAAAPGRGAQ